MHALPRLHDRALQLLEPLLATAGGGVGAHPDMLLRDRVAMVLPTRLGPRLPTVLPPPPAVLVLPEGLLSIA